MMDDECSMRLMKCRAGRKAHRLARTRTHIDEDEKKRNSADDNIDQERSRQGLEEKRESDALGGERKERRLTGRLASMRARHNLAARVK